MEDKKQNISEDLLPLSTKNRTLGGFSNFAIWFSCSMVTTVMLTGMYFIPEVSFAKAIILIFVGSLVGIIPLVLIGVVGQKTGLVTMVAARATFGNRGANLPSIMNALIYIGWQWAQAALGGLALNYISVEITGFNNPALFTIITEGIVIVVALFAIKGISIWEKIAAICIGLIMLIVIIKAFTVTGMENIINLEPKPVEGYTGMYIFDIVVASALSWVAMSADYNRNCKTVRGTTLGTGVGYTLGTLFSMGAGALMVCMVLVSGAQASYDPSELFGQVGFGIPGAIVIFMSIISANVMCMYSSTMSIIQMFPKFNYVKTALVVGIICILGALFSGILDTFLGFVNLIAVIFMPIFAIIIADFFVLKKQKLNINAVIHPEDDKEYEYSNGINWVAIIVFVLCAVFCYVFSYIYSLPTGATIPTFFITFFLYIILMKVVGKKK